ncbi:MAG: hypothetical protein GXP27_18565 [Planctomycetes bacterium]|nr:hypothetical protein [Planctomycetota bacterium]
MAPFNRRGLVLLPWDENFRRRDEFAGMVLARHLPLATHDNIEIRHVPLQHPEWGAILEGSEQLDMIVFFGRLRLYGREAEKKWGGRRLHFRFPPIDRPADLPPGELDEDYHAIEERRWDGRWRKLFRTKDVDGIRTDYALVQRYHTRLGDRSVCVILCAGCSSLGTLGGVRWILQLPHAVFTLPKDKRVTSVTPMEAIVEVKADLAAYPSPWHQLQPVEAKRLYLGKLMWVPGETPPWLPIPPQRIQVKLDEEGSPVEIKFDRKTFWPTSGKSTRLFTIGLLAAAVKAAAAAPDEDHSIESLGEDPAVLKVLEETKTGKGGVPTLEQLRRNLRLLRKRHLGIALSCTPKTFRFQARLEVENARVTVRTRRPR